MAEISTLKEQTFDYNEFNQPKYLSGIDALAKLLLNLLLMEPNTIPSSPGMGVGIANYKMEFSTSEVYAEIQGIFQTQINKYLPQYAKFVRRILIEKIPEKQLHGGGNGIYIGVAISGLDGENGETIIIFTSVNKTNNSEVKMSYTIV